MVMCASFAHNVLAIQRSWLIMPQQVRTLMYILYLHEFCIQGYRLLTFLLLAIISSHLMNVDIDHGDMITMIEESKSKIKQLSSDDAKRIVWE